MIRVTVEIVPGGDEKLARHLGTAIIYNDLTDSLHTDGEIGSYQVRLSKFDNPRRTWKRGQVSGFHRRTRGPWDLLLLALLDTVGKRNKKHVREAAESLS